jgi:hypothetical protein
VQGGEPPHAIFGAVELVVFFTFQAGSPAPRDAGLAAMKTPAWRPLFPDQ